MDTEQVMEIIQKLRDDFVDWETIETAIQNVKENEAEDAWVRDQEAKIRNYYSA